MARLGLDQAQAWALYTNAAVQCHDSLLLPESESNKPRTWKRMHGLLLGMRAAVEGAAASARVPSAAEAKGVSRISSSSALGREQALPAEPGQMATREEGALLSSSTTREAETAAQAAAAAAALAQFAADVTAACEVAPPPLLSPTPQYCDPKQVPAQQQARVATSEDEAVAAAAVAAAPLNGRTTATMTCHLHSSPPPSPAGAATGVDIAFRCLSHRQAAVREAAIGLLHAQARTLGPRAALALYRRTIRTLEHEQEKTRLSELVRAAGARRAPAARVSAPHTRPAPDVNSPSGRSIEGGATAALPPSGGRCQRCIEKRVGLKNFRGEVSQEAPSSRAEMRRRNDRVGGLLGLLERIVGRDGLPSGTVGSSWEGLFSILR